MSFFALCVCFWLMNLGALGFEADTKENELLYIDAERWTPYRRIGGWDEARELVSRIRASNDETPYTNAPLFRVIESRIKSTHVYEHRPDSSSNLD